MSIKLTSDAKVRMVTGFRIIALGLIVLMNPGIQKNGSGCAIG